MNPPLIKIFAFLIFLFCFGGLTFNTIPHSLKLWKEGLIETKFEYLLFIIPLFGIVLYLGCIFVAYLYCIEEVSLRTIFDYRLGGE